MTNQEPEFSLHGADALRAAFRRHASGVAVITSVAKSGEPIGFTATSVTSLGSNPPLVSFNISRGASSYPHLVPGVDLAIHALTRENLELAKIMSGPKEARFESELHTWSHGVPIFLSAAAILIGRVRTRLEVEANAVVVVDVLRGSENPDTEPLLYFKRGYHTSGERLADNF